MGSSILFLSFFLFALVNGKLTPHFYDKSCPQALSIIEGVVRSSIAKEQRMGASLLRLHFHDCFVNGCEGSVLLDDTPIMKGEKHSGPNNNSLRGFEVVDEIKYHLEQACPGVVSCANLLAIAARDSVVIEVLYHTYVFLVVKHSPWWWHLESISGRKDSTHANISDANRELPLTFGNLTEQIFNFQKKGLNVKDLVVLTGAHTIGQARCSSIFFNFLFNRTIDPDLLKSLKERCPGMWGGPAENDVYPIDETPNTFDNTFYKNLVEYKGVLITDQELYGNKSTDSMVVKYSKDSSKFFDRFGKAMIKMGNIGVLTGSAGEVRKVCRKVNGV